MSQRNQVYLILLHIGLGILIAKLPFFSKFYAILIFFVGLFIVLKNKNRNNEILYVIAYVAGSEVLLRTRLKFENGSLKIDLRGRIK